jgi:membrane-bound ClpP family serine protease
MCCKKCMGFFGIIILIIGILFLLRDLNVWNFWNIQGWTMVFLLIGLLMFFTSGCPECQCCKMEKTVNKEVKTKKK